MFKFYIVIHMTGPFDKGWFRSREAAREFVKSMRCDHCKKEEGTDRPIFACDEEWDTDRQGLYYTWLLFTGWLRGVFKRKR